MRVDARQKMAPAAAPTLARAGASAVSPPELALEVDGGRSHNATVRHTALLSTTPYAQRSGHAQRAHLVQQLQAGYGNHHVSHVIARIRQGQQGSSQLVSARKAAGAESAVQHAAVADADRSMRGQALLARDYTPVVQPNGPPVHPSADQDADAQAGLADPLSEKGMTDSQSSQNTGIQPLLSPFNAGVSDRPSDTPPAHTQATDDAPAIEEKAAELNYPGVPRSVNIASPPESSAVVKSSAIVEVSSAIAKAETASAQLLPTEATPVIADGKALKTVPEARALQELLAGTGADTTLPEMNVEAASTDTATENEQSTTDASETLARLDEKDAEAARPISPSINFVVPSNAITLKGEGVFVFLRRRRDIASRMADQFLTAAANRIHTLTQLGHEISAPLQTAAEDARASITAVVVQRRAEVVAQIAQQREEAQRAAQETNANIQNQYQTAVATISQTTAEDRGQVETEHKHALRFLDTREKEQLATLDRLYARTNDQWRATGVKVGDEAITVGEEMARNWESQIKGYDDNFWDGPLTDDRLRARANATREVAKQYKPALIDAARKNADEVLPKGKAKDIEGIHSIGKQLRQSLATQRANVLDALASTEQQALSRAQATQTNLTEAASQSLKAALQSLDLESATVARLLTAYSQRQLLAVEKDTQAAIASLHGGVNQAVTNLQSMLKSICAEMQGRQTPDLNALSSVLAELLGQADDAVATAQAATRQGIAASEQGINEGGQIALEGIATIGESAIEQVTATGEGLTATLADLGKGATQTFKDIQRIHTTTSMHITSSALKVFQQATRDIQTGFERTTKELDSSLQQSVEDVERGLRDTFREMRAKIEEEAKKAADQVEPRWKKVLKWIVVGLVIIVTVAVAVVAGPAVIGAVGALAGAFGASAAAASFIATVAFGAVLGAAAGALIQMGNNLIDGKNLFDGVGKAALVGAIGGALGGAGAGLSELFVAGEGLLQSALRFGVDTISNIAGGILGDLAVGDPITLEGVLIGAAVGAGLFIGAAGLAKVGEVISGQREFPLGSRPNTELPPVSRPELQVKPAELEVSPLETSGRSTHWDEPELEPGVVAKQVTSDGHTIKVLGDGRVFCCTTCVPMDLGPGLAKGSSNEKLRGAKRKRDDDTTAEQGKGKKAKKVQVEWDSNSNTVVVTGRVEFDQGAKQITVRSGQDRRHVVGYDEAIKPAFEAVTSIALKELGVQKFQEEMSKIYKKLKIKKGRNAQAEITKQLQFGLTKLNSSRGNLNPENAAENQAIEHVRGQGLTIVEKFGEAFKVELPVLKKAKEIMIKGFKLSGKNTDITNFADGIRTFAHTRIEQISNIEELNQFLFDMITSTGVDLNKASGAKLQTAFALAWLGRVKVAMDETIEMGAATRLEILYDLWNIPSG